MIPDAPKTKEELAVLLLDLNDCHRTLGRCRKYLQGLIDGKQPNLFDARDLLRDIKYDLDITDAEKIRMKRIGLVHHLGRWVPPED